MTGGARNGRGDDVRLVVGIPLRPAAPGMPLRSLRCASPFASRKGTGVGAFDSPFGGIFVRRGVVEGSPRLGVACERLVVIGLYSSTADVARPSALREASLKDQPPSSLDCSSCWCCSLFRPALRKDVCRVDRPFARTLNGRPRARGQVWKPAPARVLLLRVPACAVLTLVRRLRGCFAPPLSFGHFPRERGKPCRGAALRLGTTVWLAMVSSEPAVLLRIRALQLQRSS